MTEGSLDSRIEDSVQNADLTELKKMETGIYCMGIEGWSVKEYLGHVKRLHQRTELTDKMFFEEIAQALKRNTFLFPRATREVYNHFQEQLDEYAPD